jgi:type IV pilus assembly protein PilA
MLATLRKRIDREDEGFTLIELMVVVLIIAILLAIAIPTFLGAQDRARDRSAQSNLRNGITAAKTIATDAEGFFLDDSNPAVAVNAADLEAVEGSIDFVDTAPAEVGDVGVNTAADGSWIVLNAVSGSGKGFCMAATSTGAVTYGSANAAANLAATAALVNTTGECDDPEF